jgi:outer membrane protein W
MVRCLTRLSLGVALVAGLAQPAAAQVVHSFNANIGFFSPRGADSRDHNDVLLANLSALVFNIGDFDTAEVQGEWNVTFGDHVEAGFGVGYHQAHAHAFYRDYVDSAHNNSNIYQELGMRVIPIQAVVRFMPFGRTGTFQPYVGAGIGVLPWRYSEIGSFIDPSLTIFDARYVDTGTAVGPIFLGGAKIPIGGDVYAMTFEVRYQHGVGTLDPNQQFAGSKIDLSGISTKFGFLVRF